MAVKSGDILEGAKVFGLLEDALADCHLSFGTTRRFGKYRDHFFSPSSAAEQIQRTSRQGRVALVFGREDNGLTTRELSLCRHFLTIDTDPLLPSMNLAQAVAVCLYETYKNTRQKAGGGESEPLPVLAALQEEMFRHMKRVMLDIEYLNPQNPEHIFLTYRRIFNRASLNEREVRILHGLWARIAYIAGKSRVT